MQDETHLALGRIAEHLKRHRVKFVVIGGWSIDANFPELNYRTQDIDFIIATSDRNYERISAALNSLKVRETRGGIPMKETATFGAARLRYKDHWRLFAADGIFDLMVDAAAIENYKQVARSSRRIRLAGSNVKVRVANPKVVLDSKILANREKDLRITAALQRAIDERASASPLTRLRERHRARKRRRVGLGKSRGRTGQQDRERTPSSLQPQVAAAATPRCGHVGKRSGVPCIRPPHRTGPHRYQ